jgi:hypothetical protein
MCGSFLAGVLITEETFTTKNAKADQAPQIFSVSNLIVLVAINVKLDRPFANEGQLQNQERPDPSTQPRF